MAEQRCGHFAHKIVETPDPKRLGWLRGECSVCGCFLGYRDGSDKGRGRRKGYDETEPPVDPEGLLYEEPEDEDI